MDLAPVVYKLYPFEVVVYPKYAGIDIESAQINQELMHLPRYYLLSLLFNHQLISTRSIKNIA